VSRERRTTVHVVVSLVLSLACLIAGGFTGPVLTWLLIIGGFGFFLDAATLAWSRTGGTLRDFRQ
jgi:hypothetical protein